jgi:ribokinase
VSIYLAVTTPAFLDLTFVGLEALPGPGEERFAGDLLRSPGGGAITVVAAARLGLRSALVAPLGDDLAGEFVRREVEAEDVLVAGYTPSETPQTVVMPVGDQRTMVTVDPGIRARAADLAELHPAAVACNVAQLDLVPDGARAYLTCGDDDARAFAGRAPAGLADIQALFLGVPDAITLTGADGVEAAAEKLAETIPTVVLTLGARGLLAIVDGRRVEVPEFDARPVVDPTGDRDLMCAAYAWADLRGASVEDALAWSWLYTRLAMTVPTATGGALTEEQLLEEGAARGLVAPAA